MMKTGLDNIIEDIKAALKLLVTLTVSGVDADVKLHNVKAYFADDETIRIDIRSTEERKEE